MIGGWIWKWFLHVFRFTTKSFNSLWRSCWTTHLSHRISFPHWTLLLRAPSLVTQTRPSLLVDPPILRSHASTYAVQNLVKKSSTKTQFINYLLLIPVYLYRKLILRLYFYGLVWFEHWTLNIGYLFQWCCLLLMFRLFPFTFAGFFCRVWNWKEKVFSLELLIKLMAGSRIGERCLLTHFLFLYEEEDFELTAGGAVNESII